MNTQQSMIRLSSVTADEINHKQLAYMAYTGQYEFVHSFLRTIPVERRNDFSEKNILNQAIWGSIEKIKEHRKLQNHQSINAEKDFATELMDQFISYCRSIKLYPRELFQSILYLSEEFIQLSLLSEAMNYLEQALTLGINRYPELRVDAINKIALIDNNKGKVTESANRLLHLAEHPYLITDRNQIPEVFFKLGRSTLKNGDIEYYKRIMFFGLRFFYTNTESRGKIINQITATYRSSLKLVLDKHVSITDKLIYLLHRFYFGLPGFHKIKLGIINKAADKFLLSVMYVFNYIRRAEPIRLKRDSNQQRKIYPILNNVTHNSSTGIINIAQRKEKKILITRAMGGIGDLLMMTAGFHSLKKKYPSKEIHLAIPRRYFQIFNGNPDVKLIDIEGELFSHLSYSRWIDFTDCPASRNESRKAPYVKKNRIDIFARAMGIRGIRLLKMNRTPRYFISQTEQDFANDFFERMNLKGKTVIGVQLHSEESYRDYPLMEKLVASLSRKYKVLLFDGQSINGFDFDNVLKIDSFGLRDAFALTYKCNAVIAPDSSFVHFAAAFKIPTVALYGPIDGKVRTRHYPKCKYVDVRDQLGCLPCWRNESIPCKLTGMRNSACMESIPVQKIIHELENILIGDKNENPE